MVVEKEGKEKNIEERNKKREKKNEFQGVARLMCIEDNGKLGRRLLGQSKTSENFCKL